MKGTAFAPGSVGNVGPGFDVLGLAVDGIGDTVTVELASEWRVEVHGRDAASIPTDPKTNTAAIAAAVILRRENAGGARIIIEKGLPLCGGLGGSASSSVAGAYAAALACGIDPNPTEIIAAALEGEAFVSGSRHLDNVAPIALGGLVLARSIDPLDVISLPVPADWSVVLATPSVRIETKQARSILPAMWDRHSWIQQMANTSALIAAFATADGALARRSLDDLYAEPLRAPLIPRFRDLKNAALDAGAFGCSISGAGPTVFAIVDESNRAAVLAAMRAIEPGAFGAAIAKEGVRRA